jgi:hypothetical protein
VREVVDDATMAVEYSNRGGGGGGWCNGVVCSGNQ